MSKFSPITVRFTREFLVGADWNDKLTSETDNGAPPCLPKDGIIRNIELSSLPGFIQQSLRRERDKVSQSILLLLLILGYLEVHPTPVGSRLALLDVLHPQLCRTGAELEVSSGPELCLVAPASPQVPGAVTGVVTGNKRRWERGQSVWGRDNCGLYCQQIR